MADATKPTEPTQARPSSKSRRVVTKRGEAESVKSGESAATGSQEQTEHTEASEADDNFEEKPKFFDTAAQEENEEETAVDDDDEERLEKEAEEEEQRTLRVVMSQKALPTVSDVAAAEAAAGATSSSGSGAETSEASAKIEEVWPEAMDDKELINDNSKWPDLRESEENVEKWVVENKILLIRAVTWNLCARAPPEVEATNVTLLPKNKYHMYMIGTEECERSIAASAMNPSKKNWEEYLGKALGDMYVPLRSHTLQAIHLIVFVHKGLAHLCSEMFSGAVATGIGGTLGNKGGVGISMWFGNTKLVVANAHLAAHQNAVKRRNEEYNKIRKELPLVLAKKMRSASFIGARRSSENLAAMGGGESTSAGSGDSQKGTTVIPRKDSIDSPSGSVVGQGQSSNTERLSFSGVGGGPASPLEDCGDRVIFMGDLNYRIRGNKAVVSKLLDHNMHAVCVNNDQLRWSKDKGLVLDNMVEPPLNFRPTYKYDLDSDIYDTSAKARIPAWTDRIFYKESGMECLAYNADESIKTSDHRPVYATFRVEVEFGEGHEILSPSKRSKIAPEFASESQVCSIM